MQIGLDGLLDIGAWFISEVNYVLDYSYSEINESNTKSKEYFWAQIQSAIWLKQLKQYNQKKYVQQYDQSNQSNANNNTTRAIQWKQYDQQYNQEKPGKNKGYIVNSSYAKIRDPSKKPDILEVDVGR